MPVNGNDLRPVGSAYGFGLAKHQSSPSISKWRWMGQNRNPMAKQKCAEWEIPRSCSETTGRAARRAGGICENTSLGPRATGMTGVSVLPER